SGFGNGNGLRGTPCPESPVSTSSPRVSRKINNIFLRDFLFGGFRGRRTRIFVTTALPEKTTLILSTLGTRHPGEPCRCYTRKPPNKKSQRNMLLIFRKTLGVDVDTVNHGHQ
ncbi:hypothetical protein TSAR_005289, partial [Trichomalopsis sarcophagae]